SVNCISKQSEPFDGIIDVPGGFSRRYAKALLMQIIKHKRTWPYVSGSEGEVVEQFAQTPCANGTMPSPTGIHPIAKGTNSQRSSPDGSVASFLENERRPAENGGSV
ncbi:MAG: hypothetical protein ACLPIC_08340, partial [Rhodoblastus sp.]|uniref:hypothetical protein n=1 Tax=Rhodoblastus sp. TaxID=1962975 RepID=UPI003F988A6B